MAGRTRNIQVIFRVDEQERGLIRQKMELMGVRNMQAYLRKMAIDGYAVKLDLPELREAVAMLGRYNGNINQIAKRANETGRVYDNQALLAARAGAAYVSPFLGRLDDISQPGIDLIRTIADIFANYPDIDTEIIAASVRNPIHVTDCALAGADIATVPYKVIEQMTHHPLTDQGIEKFKKDYIKVFGE